MTKYSFEPIAHIYNDYKEKFGIPRQAGLVDEVESRIIFTEKYRNADAIKDLEDFSHLWLIWVFSEGFASRKDPSEADINASSASFSPTVRPPRLGGNERISVFATRSPNRPNPIGLSVVTISGIDIDTPDGPVIRVKGADLMNGTPLLDIKPYIVYADSHPDAVSGFAASTPDDKLTVTGLENLPDDVNKKAVRSILARDPRPAYRSDSDRIYGMAFGDYNIRFTVDNNEAKIVECIKE